MKQPKKRKRRGITARLLLLPLRERCAREQGQEKKKKKRPPPPQKNQGSSNLKSLCCFSWMGFIAGHWETDWEREKRRKSGKSAIKISHSARRSVSAICRQGRKRGSKRRGSKQSTKHYQNTQTTADNSRQTGQMTVEHKLQHCHHHHRHRNLVNLSLPLLL